MDTIVSWLFKLEFVKKPNEDWMIVICSNRYNVSKPIVLENYKKTNILLNYEIKKTNFFGSTVPVKFFFFFYINKKLIKSKNYSINKIFKKKLNFGKLKFELKCISGSKELDPIKSIDTFINPNYTNKHQKCLELYVHDINKKLMKNHWKFRDGMKYVIYWNINPFKKIPIVCSLLSGTEDSNVKFWDNCLSICKDVYKANGVVFEPNICFPNLFCLKNTLVDEYILEKIDSYFPSWYVDSGDCDEANMIYLLYKLFINCDLSSHEELNNIKNYILKNYLCFYSFCLVTQPSAQTSFKQKDVIQGHWIVVFIPREFFLNRLKRTNSRLKNENKQLLTLFCEPTVFFYPSNKKPKRIKNKLLSERLVEERTMQFYDKGYFYKCALVFYTINKTDEDNVFNKHLPDEFKRRYGFYCSFNGIYGIPFHDLLSLSNRMSFVSFPKLTKELINYIKYSEVNYMLPNPSHFYIDSNNKHKEFYVTNKSLDGKFEKLNSFFNKNFKLIVKKSNDMIQIYKTIYSFDDLFKPKIRISIIKHFKGYQLKLKLYQVMAMNYFYILIFYKKKILNVDYLQ